MRQNQPLAQLKEQEKEFLDIKTAAQYRQTFFQLFSNLNLLRAMFLTSATFGAGISSTAFHPRVGSDILILRPGILLGVVNPIIIHCLEDLSDIDLQGAMRHAIIAARTIKIRQPLILGHRGLNAGDLHRV